MQFQFLEAFSFPVNTLSNICFLLNTLKNFKATVKSLQYSYRLSSEDDCNDYAAQTMFYQNQAFQTEKNKKEKARFWLIFLIFKKSQVRQKPDFKIWLQKC